MRVKRLASDRDWEVIRLLKRTVTPHSLCLRTAESINNAEMKSTWKPLNEVPSAQEGDRRSYLQKNIIDRYYSRNTDISALYFANGEN